jgi:hypothetical protein
MSSQLAANHWNQQQAEQEERMRMKKLTLDINERQEQEDYQGTKSFTVWVWSYTPIIPAFRRLRQKNHKFEPIWATY